MKKPSPESSSIISHEFEDLTGTLMPLDQVESLKNVGDLLFTREEMNATQDLLVHAFRRLCVHEHVTLAYFNEKYKRYAITVLGKTPQAAANNRANIIKMLKRGDSISWKKFLELTQLVLGLRPEIINIVFSSTVNSEQIQISTKPTEMRNDTRRRLMEQTVRRS